MKLIVRFICNLKEVNHFVSNKETLKTENL